MSNDYTLPPAYAFGLTQSRSLEDYGHAVAAPLLARIAELEAARDSDYEFDAMRHDRDRVSAEVEALTAANAALRECLRECADDLEAEVSARSSGELSRRIERYLEPVRKARALLAQPSTSWVNPLAAEMEALRADAERWKWRKENPTARLVYAGGSWRVENWTAWHPSADAAVDAAIAARKGEGSEG